MERPFIMQNFAEIPVEQPCGQGRAKPKKMVMLPKAARRGSRILCGKIIFYKICI